MHLEPKCNSCNQKCQKVCVSKLCLVKNPFICDQCRPQHYQDCQIMSYKKLILQFHQKQGLKKKLFMQFQNEVQTTFRELMNSLKEQFIKFREQFEHFNAPEQIVDIYRKIKANNQAIITAKELAEARKIKESKMIDFQLKDKIQMRMLKNQIFSFHRQILNRLYLYYAMKDQFESFQVQGCETNIIRQIRDKYSHKKYQISKLLIGHHYQDFEKMLGQKIYDLKPIFRASEHGFIASKFHEICDGISNTLTMAKTQYGRIIGGYCPLPWNSPNKWEYHSDTSHKAFIFSLSKSLKCIKYTAQKSKFAIAMQKDYGPVFGDDFVIYNNANRSKGCWSNFPDVYNSKQNPIQHTQKIIHEFIGVQDHYERFNLEEWQVYRIAFSEQDLSFMIKFKQL